MAPESINQNDRKSARFSPRLPVTVFLFVALIFWVKNQLPSSASHSVQATGDDNDLHPEPQHPIPFAHWDVFDGDGTDPPEYFWGKDDFNPNNGNYSAWCARDGANGLDPANFFYPANADSWMVYGPFSLENYDEAVLEFWYWNKSEDDPLSEFDFFSWRASIDNNLFFGDPIRGNSNDWQFVEFNLKNVPDLGDLTGWSPVWIAFQFRSDHKNISNEEYTYDGAFVDDIVLKAWRPGSEENEFEILMSENFEGVFPPVLNVESSYLPVIMKSGS